MVTRLIIVPNILNHDPGTSEENYIHTFKFTSDVWHRNFNEKWFGR